VVAKASGTMPDGWVVTTVARVGSVRLGRQRSPKHLTGRHNTRYVRPANISAAGEFDLNDILEMDFTPEEKATYALRSGDVLLVDSSGSASQVGRAALWRDQVPGCCYQNHLIRFRPHVALPEYALAVFRHLSLSGEFAAVARGIGIQHLGSSRLAEMPFPLPPLAEQQRIVDEIERRVTDLAAAEMSLASALKRTSEQDRLILDAAVSGALVEPEAALSARENRSFEPASALLARTRVDQDRSLLVAIDTNATDPADAPPGWVFPTVGNVGDVRLGRQRAPQFEHGDHPTPYLRAANITSNGLDLNDVLSMNFTPDERRVYELQSGDVILTEASGSAAHVGRSAIWRGEIAGCCFQNTVIRFRSRAVSPEYAFLVFRHLAESGAFARTARGVGIQHLGASRLASLPFPLPPAAEQDRIVAEAEIRLTASHNQREIVEASMHRFDHMRREIWATAVRGRLVAQHPDDEPAEALLARLGPPPELLRPSPELSGKETVVTKPPRRAGGKSHTVRPLAAVLSEAGHAIPVPELFAAAGYDRDSAGDVERFYIALREEIGRTIEPAGDTRENAPVELRHAS
jgi:restriction endonuclease S subunit